MKVKLLSAVTLVLAACNGAVVPVGEVNQKQVAEDVDAPTENDGGSGSSVPTGVSCGLPSGSTHAFTSVEDIQARIAGRWRICDGAIWSPADVAGIEIGATEAHFLVASGGALVRGPTIEYDRKVSFLDTTAMNGPNGPFTYQIGLSSPLGGGNSYMAAITESGDRLQLFEHTSFNEIRLIREP